MVERLSASGVSYLVQPPQVHRSLVPQSSTNLLHSLVLSTSRDFISLDLANSNVRNAVTPTVHEHGGLYSNSFICFVQFKYFSPQPRSQFSRPLSARQRNLAFTSSSYFGPRFFILRLFPTSVHLIFDLNYSLFVFMSLWS